VAQHIYPQTERIHHLPLADVSFGDLLLTVFEIFLFVIWIWILFTIIGDLFRDHEMSGWGKALWIIVLVFIPYIGMLVYLIARGSGMRERALQAQSEAKHHFDSYVQEQAHTSPADELHKLNDLKEKGALSEAEFDQAKAKLLV
jgi:ABC-type multidrug transport system fused ATPase/permease subunit